MRKTIGASEGSSIFLFGICAGNLLALFLNLALIKVKDAFYGMSLYSWLGYAIMQLGFVLTCIIYSKVRKLDQITICRFKKPRNPKQFIILPFIAIATILVFLPLANLWSKFLGVIGYSGSGATMPDYSNVGIYFLSLLLMALLPAFGEEWLIRGNLFSGLSTRGTWFGILMSSAFFSIMHSNPLQSVHQFGLGIVLAIVLLLTDSIFACMIIHFLNNFISVTLTAYLPQVDEWYLILGNWNYLTGFGSIVVGLILLLFCFYMLYKWNGQENYTVVGNTIVYDEFSLSISSGTNNGGKGNPIKDVINYYKLFFSKQGWIRITRTLERQTTTQFIGKKQPMVGVWIAFGMICIYWLYIFIYNLVV